MKELKCPHCGCDLVEWGMSIPAIVHYTFDEYNEKEDEYTFLNNIIDKFPHDDDEVTCGRCNEAIPSEIYEKCNCL